MWWRAGRNSLFCLGKRGRRNGAEPYQKAILAGGGYRGGGIACDCCGHIWADKFEDTDANEDSYGAATDKTVSTDAEERV